MKFDDLDRKILQHISEGVYSYEDLAELCKAGRNTVYRRIEKLEKMDLITRKITAFPNFEKLNLSAVVIGLDVKYCELNKAIDILKKQSPVTFLWKTYGSHDLIVILICEKDDIGRNIYDLKNELEKADIHPLTFHESVGVSWEKIHLTPY